MALAKKIGWLMLLALGCWHLPSCHHVDADHAPIRVVTDSSLSYFKDIAPIIKTNCLQCHTAKGPGPIRLDTYDGLNYNAEMVKYVTKNHIMPPWLADSSGWAFANVRHLPDEDLAKLHKWINGGLYKGDSATIASTNIDTSAARVPDLIFRVPKPFSIKGDNKESIVTQFINIDLPDTFPVESMEFVSKQPKVAHHMTYFFRAAQRVRMSQEQAAIVGERFEDSTLLMFGLSLPGWKGLQYPPGFGFTLPKKGQLEVEMHYGPSPKDALDSVEIRVYRAKQPIVRPCFLVLVHIWDPLTKMSPTPFEIPPGATKTFTMTRPLQQDMTVLSVTPHMHFIGKNITATLIDPQGKEDTVVNVPKWDFGRQEQYFCQPFHHILANSEIKVVGTFDNTADNRRNPVKPPVLVKYGWESRSEMITFIMLVTPYHKGDENLKWDALKGSY